LSISREPGKLRRYYCKMNSLETRFLRFSFVLRTFVTKRIRQLRNVLTRSMSLDRTNYERDEIAFHRRVAKNRRPRATAVFQSERLGGRCGNEVRGITKRRYFTADKLNTIKCWPLRYKHGEKFSFAVIRRAILRRVFSFHPCREIPLAVSFFRWQFVQQWQRNHITCLIS